MDTTPDTEQICFQGLCALRPRFTALRLYTLFTHTGSARAAWEASDAQLTAAGFSPEAQELFHQHRAHWNREEALLRVAAAGLRFLPLTDPTYPAALREIHDPPLGLYVRGELRAAERRMLAVVGSRNASPYGKTVTQTLVRPLAARGLTILSGLAYGIDAEAHRATLAVGGTTIAVLGSGADEDSVYPRAHRGLAQDIVTMQGAVISEFPPGTGPRPELFPQRNRIIAGMARAVLVIEATATSGALITARSALESGRDVLVIPGPITSALSEGTNRLLKEGATPICSVDDVVNALELQETLQLPRTGKTLSEEMGSGISAAVARVLNAMAQEPRSLDDLSSITTLPVHEVAAHLSVLELDGRIRDVGGKLYVRV